MLEIKEQDVDSEDSMLMLSELNIRLSDITGNSGAASFSAEDIKSRGIFVVAYVNKIAMGCGALRQYSDDIGEIKRVYARPNHIGIGTAILASLEEKARDLHYTSVILETRRVNSKAVAFYLGNGYQPCVNYGKYAECSEAICFEKKLG